MVTPAIALHQAGPNRWVPELVQDSIQQLTEQHLNALVITGSEGVTYQAAMPPEIYGVRPASRQIASHVGSAALVGALADGLFAAHEAVEAYSNGTASAKRALRHVGLEAGSGGLAAGAGLLAVTGLVVVTGGIAPATAAAVGTVAATLSKSGLRRLLAKVF